MDKREYLTPNFGLPQQFLLNLVPVLGYKYQVHCKPASRMVLFLTVDIRFSI